MKIGLLFFFLLGIYTTAFSQVHWESIILSSDQWAYFPATTEPPNDWNQADFDDSSWETAPGGIGYGDGDDETIIDHVYSLYLRIKFQIDDKSLIQRVLLDVDYDDGFVAYLNDVEIARSANVAGYPPQFNSSVSWLHEATMYAGGLPERHEVDLSNLLNGENTLSIQILNESITSSDLTGLVFLHAKVDSENMLFRPTPSWFSEPVDTGESNLPLLIIDTHGQQIVDEPKITASLGIIDNAEEINNIIDTFTFFVEHIGIEIRGSSSQMFEKKNYGFETRTSTGENLNVSLLGMPDENDWVLHGPYSDKSLMRNALIFYLGNKTGRWAPRTQFCELYINNEYRGVYVLMEKIKRDKNRLDISKLEPNEISGNDLTGGYILSIDRPDDYFWISPYKGLNGYGEIVINCLYPDYSTMPLQQKEYIQNYVTSFEDAMSSSSFQDQYIGYRAYADVGSFIDYFLVNELGKNIDAYRLSAFFHKDKGGKLSMGPLWDYNLAFGNADYYQGFNTQGWVIHGVGFEDSFQIPFWWQKIRTDSYYNSELKHRWFELRGGPFAKDSIFAYIDSVSNLLSEAQARNFSRFDVLGQWVWPNYFVGQTYEEEVDFMKNWISQRLSWMDQQINLITDVEDISVANAYETFAFPNPFSNKLTIRTAIFVPSEVEVRISNILGQIIYTKQGDYFSGTVDLDIPVDVFGSADGIYIYEVRVSDRIVATGKIIKEK